MTTGALCAEPAINTLAATRGTNRLPMPLPHIMNSFSPNILSDDCKEPMKKRIKLNEQYCLFLRSHLAQDRQRFKDYDKQKGDYW
jgi:hypothetical protein